MLIMLNGLKKQISFVLSGINKKAELPILRGVRVRQKGRKVTLTSSNLKMESSLEIYNSEPGEDDVDVVIKSDRLNRNFTSGGVFPIDTDDFDEKEASNFPIMRGRGSRKGAAAIKGAIPFIKKAMSFCSTSELKRALAGVHLFIRDGHLIVESTNRHLLYRNSSSYAGSTKETLNIVVPKDGLKQLMRMEKVFKALTFKYNERYLYVTGNKAIGSQVVNGKLIIRLIDEKFPDVDNVLLVDPSYVVLNVDTNEVLEFMNGARGEFPPNDDNPLVEFTGHMGDVKVKSLVRKHPSSLIVPIRIGFDIDYIVKILKHINHDTFHWMFETPRCASMLSPVANNQKTGELFLIMPIRLADN